MGLEGAVVSTDHFRQDYALSHSSVGVTILSNTAAGLTPKTTHRSPSTEKSDRHRPAALSGSATLLPVSPRTACRGDRGRRRADAAQISTHGPQRMAYDLLAIAAASISFFKS